jgi:hypothetical protein
MCVLHVFMLACHCLACHADTTCASSVEGMYAQVTGFGPQDRQPDLLATLTSLRRSEAGTTLRIDFSADEYDHPISDYRIDTVCISVRKGMCSSLKGLCGGLVGGCRYAMLDSSDRCCATCGTGSMSQAVATA